MNRISNYIKNLKEKDPASIYLCIAVRMKEVLEDPNCNKDISEQKEYFLSSVEESINEIYEVFKLKARKLSEDKIKGILKPIKKDRYRLPAGDIAVFMHIIARIIKEGNSFDERKSRRIDLSEKGKDKIREIVLDRVERARLKYIIETAEQIANNTSLPDVKKDTPLLKKSSVAPTNTNPEKNTAASFFKRDFSFSTSVNLIQILNSIVSNILYPTYKKIFELRIGLDKENVGKRTWAEVGRQVRKSSKWCESKFNEIKCGIMDLIKESDLDASVKAELGNALDYFSKSFQRKSILELTGFTENEFKGLVSKLTDEEIKLIKTRSFQDYYRYVEPCLDEAKKNEFSSIVLEMQSDSESEKFNSFIMKLKTSASELEVFNKTLQLPKTNNLVVILRTIIRSINNPTCKKIYELRIGLDNDNIGKRTWDEVGRQVRKSSKWCESKFNEIKCSIMDLIKKSEIEAPVKDELGTALDYFSKNFQRKSILELTGLTENEFKSLVGKLTDEEIKLIKTRSFQDYYRYVEPCLDEAKKKEFSSIVLEMQSDSESEKFNSLVEKLSMEKKGKVINVQISNSKVLDMLLSLINDYIINDNEKNVMLHRIGFNDKRKTHKEIEQILGFGWSYSTKLYTSGSRKLKNKILAKNYSYEEKACLISALSYFSRNPAKPLLDIIGCSKDDFVSKVLPNLTVNEILLLKQHSYDNYLEFILPYLSTEMRNKCDGFSFRVLSADETKRFNNLRSRLKSLANNPNYISNDAYSVVVDISNLTYTDENEFLLSMFNLLNEPYKSIMLVYFNNNQITFKKISEKLKIKQRTVETTVHRVYETFREIVEKSNLKDDEKGKVITLLNLTDRAKKPINIRAITTESILGCSLEIYQNKIKPQLFDKEVRLIDKKMSGNSITQKERSLLLRIKNIAKKILNNPNYIRPEKIPPFDVTQLNGVTDPIEIIKVFADTMGDINDKNVIYMRVGLGVDRKKYTTNEICKELNLSIRKVYVVLKEIYKLICLHIDDKEVLETIKGLLYIKCEKPKLDSLFFSGLTDPQEIIIKFCETQSEQTRRIIYYRIGYNQSKCFTAQEIANEINVPVANVHMAINAFYKKLRKKFIDDVLLKSIYEKLHPRAPKTVLDLFDCDENFYNEKIKPSLTEKEEGIINKKLKDTPLSESEKKQYGNIRRRVKIHQKLLGVTDPIEIINIIIDNDSKAMKRIISTLLKLDSTEKGNIQEASQVLGIPPKTIYRQISTLLKKVRSYTVHTTADKVAAVFASYYKKLEKHKKPAFIKPEFIEISPRKVRLLFRQEVFEQMSSPKERLLIQMRTIGINGRLWTLKEMMAAFNQDEETIIEEFKIALSHYVDKYNETYNKSNHMLPKQ